MHASAGAKQAAADGNAHNPLSIVLGHLDSSDAARQVCSTAARSLHRVSKQHQADARATLRHLPLDRYYACLKTVYPNPSNRPSAVPWNLLTACPAVTSWKLHPEQLESFHKPQWTLDDQLAAAASRIKRLDVISGYNEQQGIASSYAQQQGLGELLWACSSLEEVSVSCDFDCGMPWRALDPDSTSASTARGPPLPLRSWTSYHIPAGVIYDWLEQQQGQLATTLKQVTTQYDGEDVSRLTALRGLEELTLGYDSFPLPPGISSSLSSVTKVSMFTRGDHIDELSVLSQLSSLKLDIKSEVPAGLGVTLPNLQRLEAPAPFLGFDPVHDAQGTVVDYMPLTSLTGLTRLVLSSCGDSKPLSTALVHLRELDVSHAYVSLDNASSWTALEVLEAPGSEGLDTLTLLQPLTRLRRLNIGEVEDLEPASFSVLGALQALTHLNLRRKATGSTYMHPQRTHTGPSPACCAVLAGTPPLPALQQLDISGQAVGSGSALAPWVAKLTALTSLTLSGGQVADGEELLYLPTQLRELHLAGMGWQQPPTGLLRLPGLEMLSLAYNKGMQQLPSWMSQLQQLELLDVDKTGITTQQQVLAEMPALRCVKLPAAVSPAVMYACAPHLHWGSSKRFIEWWKLMPMEIRGV
jgi:Leucine-rich repeat (LRR) protein